MARTERAFNLHRLIVSERGVAPVLAVVIIVVAVLAAGGAAAAALLVIGGDAHPSEQTARFMPSDTQVYLSLNRRPGDSQLKKFRSILGRFREHSQFQPKIDKLFDDAETEAGIHPEEDVLPWLGPEIAVGFVDVVGSVVAGSAGGTPLLIAIAGTTDPERSLSVLREWIDYQTRDLGLAFTTETYRGQTVHSETEDNQQYAVTEDYLVLASDMGLLEDTIDRILDDDTNGSLFSSSRFKKARDALPDPRFFMAYVDGEGIWRDARQLAGAAITAEARRQIEEFIPEWAAVTGAFIDRGLDIEVYVATTGQAVEEPITTNSLAAAQLLPADTLAFASLAFEPDLGPAREQLKEQRLGDLGLDVFGLSSALGLASGPEATLSDLLDELLKMLDDAYGVDLEQDVLAWMNGEVSLGLLPTDFRKTTTDPLSEAVAAVALIQFDGEKRDKVVSVTAGITSLLESELGLKGEEVAFGGGVGTVFDLREMAGAAAYEPGYLILGDHLIVATTADTLELAASTSKGQGSSLLEEPEYSRLVAEYLEAGSSFLLFANLRGIANALVEALDPAQRNEYQDRAEPFVQPLRALLVTGEVRDRVSRTSIVITIE